MPMQRASAMNPAQRVSRVSTKVRCARLFRPEPLAHVPEEERPHRHGKAVREGHRRGKPEPTPESGSAPSSGGWPHSNTTPGRRR